MRKCLFASFFVDFMSNKSSNLKPLNVVLSVVDIVEKSHKNFRLFQQYMGYRIVLFGIILIISEHISPLGNCINNIPDDSS